MAAIKALEQWCRSQCDGYRDVAITNMTSSFRNGMAFCALIHKYRPDLIDYDSLRKEDVFENNSLAFQIAEEKLGIPALLDAEDMVALRVPDRLSILTYVSQYYNYFKGQHPTGGIKRPAEGSKEEPSEKKNLPVAAKTFVSKTAREKDFSPAAPSSPRVTRAAVQKPVLSEHANKAGTLNSKCVACKSHVHLVQRHFVDGKLFHRSCFRCSECSSVLHSGGYKPGRIPGAFVCTSHQKGLKPLSSELGPKNGPASSAVPPKASPLASSLLSVPLDVPVPVSPRPPSPSWTASAQRTQAARRRFFQAAPPVAGSDRKPSETSGVLGETKVPMSPGEETNGSRTRVRKNQAEENRSNNNNKRQVTVRFDNESSSAGERPKSCSRAPSRTGTRPPAEAHTQWQSQPPPVRTEPPSKDAGLLDPAQLREVPAPRPLPPSEPLGVQQVQLRLPVWAPTSDSRPRPPAAESAPAFPPGAKKGKYLSPTNTFKTEMRSPSVRSRHLPLEQIEKELQDMEASVAQLEREGVELERRLRSCEEEGKADVLMDPLMVDWFHLIRRKQMYIRKESELVYIARTQELEQQQPGVEGELRRLLEKPDHLKSREEQQQQEQLMQRLMEIVDGRNAIVDGLDEDRRREVEEDQQLNEMMKSLRVKKAKSKRKSSISKLFRRRSKRRVE